MGAWGVNFDECDGALDFLGDVEDSRDWSAIENRISTYVEGGGYEEAEEVVAALELIAAALGRPSPRLKPVLVEWAKQHASAARNLNGRSLDAVSLVTTTSELSELWAEADESKDWQATIADLHSRLKA